MKITYVLTEEEARQILASPSVNLFNLPFQCMGMTLEVEHPIAHYQSVAQWRCDKCDLDFKSHQQLGSHRRWHHSKKKK